MIKKVLVIGYVWPEPTSSAAGWRMVDLLNMLRAQGCSLWFASAARKTQYMADLSALGITTQSIRLNDSAFDTWIEQLMPDAVIFDRFVVEEQFSWRVARVCPQAIRILDTEDLHFLRHAREQAIKKGRECTLEDLSSEQALRECASIWRCDLSLLVSDYEMQLLQTQFNMDAALLHHLPLVVDNRRRPAWNDFAQREGFVTIGNFRHAPNWDSVQYLQQAIWPRIRQRLPKAQVHVYGAYPPKKAMHLHRPEHGFWVHGRAADAQRVLADARVCLAPLRFGAGIKGKLLEAMFVGTPSITTSIGCEGMAPKNAWPGLIADTPEALAQAAVRLYRDEALWQASQQKAHTLLEQRFDWVWHQKKLWQRLCAIKANLRAHRRDNFIGGMLQYHLLKGTEYLSRWIECKRQHASNPD